MPGGQGGGAGGLAGMLIRGITNGGGAAGMGMNGQNGSSRNTEPSSDIYDVDRWKRADDLDSGFEPTMVQTVRDAWERETEEKKKNSLGARIHRLTQRNKRGENRHKTLKREKRMERRARGKRARRDDYERERNFENAEIEKEREYAREKRRSEEEPNRVRASYSTERPRGTLEGNTIITPGMRKATHHIPETFPEDGYWNDPVRDHSVKRSVYKEKKRNSIGLSVPAGIDSFFSSSPLNSTLLAVDSLSAGPLTLNQIRQEKVPISQNSSFIRTEQSVSGSDFLKDVPAPSGGHPAEQADSFQRANMNMISDRGGLDGGSSVHSHFTAAGNSRLDGNRLKDHTETRYMNAVREGREQRKYEVHIRNH